MKKVMEVLTEIEEKANQIIINSNDQKQSLRKAYDEKKQLAREKEKEKQEKEFSALKRKIINEVTNESSMKNIIKKSKPYRRATKKLLLP